MEVKKEVEINEIAVESEKIDLTAKMVELFDSSRLSLSKFCWKFMVEPENVMNWLEGRNKPMVAVPFLMEMILTYERKFCMLFHTPEVMTVRELRKKTGLSQKKFCKKYRLKYSTYTKWEMNLHSTPECIVHMIETLLAYEDEFGPIDEPEWSKLACNYSCMAR